MSYEPPNAFATFPLTLRFTYGTSAYQPVDDPHSWPHPNGPVLTHEETRALSAKLAYLHTAAADLKQQLEPADDRGLVSFLEDEGTHALRYAIPEALHAQIDAYLEAGAERLLEGDSKGAVAQLRTAEVLLRLLLGWGQAEMQAFVPGVAGLEKGERAAVVIETDVKIEPDGSEALSRMTHWLEAEGLGKATVSYRLRDWLISRQRYWGTPIPILYCDNCGLAPEKEENLPIVLPEDVAFMPTGESPLKHHAGFLHATCPECGGPAVRETDTMDVFVDSSWYWFRYLSPHRDDAPLDKELAAKWTPVEQYTGGVEHAILHLLYARFFTKVIRDLGFIDAHEPFQRLRNQGMILGEDNEKMSKSRGNVVNPDDLVAEYGADTVRAYLMFIGPWEAGGPWSSIGIEGVARFLNRVWALLTEAPKREAAADTGAQKELHRAVHHAVKEVSGDLAGLQFNTAIAELMTLTNVMGKAKSLAMVKTETWLESVKKLLLLLAPIAPHLADELWERGGFADSVHQQRWPEFDAAALEQDTVTIAVQVSGKRRGEITVPKDADQDAVMDAAKAEPNVARHLGNGQIVREIVVPGRLVNIVVKG